MTTINGVDHRSAPADHDALFRTYYRHVVALVRRAGISPANTEDVASEILLRLMQRDFIHLYDPSRTFLHDGQECRTSFKQFLSSVVKQYVRGLRDKERNINVREMLICDARIGEEQEDTWLEVYGPSQDGFDDSVLDQLTCSAFVTEIREYLKGVPRRSKADTCDLVALWDALVEQVEVYGESSIAALADRFGMSIAAMHAQTWWLKDNISCCLDRPTPAKRQQKPRTRRGEPTTGQPCVQEAA